MPMVTKLGRVVIIIMDQSHTTLRLHGFARSPNKLKPLYLHYYNA